MFVSRVKISSIQVKPSRLRVKKGLGVILVASGLFLVFENSVEARIAQIRDFQTYLSSVQKEKLEPIQVDASLTNLNQNEVNVPTRILIPSHEIDLPVAAAKVINGRWETFDDKAGFGLGSTTPNEVGNTVIFAHAKEGQFLNLKEVKKDSEILIFTDNNWFSYKVNEIKEVRPTDTSVISQTGESRLTLFTCSGFADSKRLIVVAEKVR